MSKYPERYKDIALAWIRKKQKESWERPSRTDYYLMRIAQRIQQTSGIKASLKDQIISFVKDEPSSMEERVARSKAIWIGGIKAVQPRDPLQGTQHGNRTRD